jgi:hypothetical protein
MAAVSRLALFGTGMPKMQSSLSRVVDPCGLLSNERVQIFIDNNQTKRLFIF